MFLNEKPLASSNTSKGFLFNGNRLTLPIGVWGLVEPYLT